MRVLGALYFWGSLWWSSIGFFFADGALRAGAVLLSYNYIFSLASKGRGH